VLAALETAELGLLHGLALALTWLVSTLFPDLRGAGLALGDDLAWTPRTLERSRRPPGGKQAGSAAPVAR